MSQLCASDLHAAVASQTPILEIEQDFILVTSRCFSLTFKRVNKHTIEWNEYEISTWASSIGVPRQRL